jgi:hypothetical protein
MSSAPKPEEIARDATWLAQALDPSAGMVRLVAMDSDSYRAASFLDDRLLQQAVDAQLVPWPEVEAAMSDAARSDARWIFHIGHVGSTLISRLLGELEGVLAVREPRLLRDLALTPPDVRQTYCAPAAKLFSRTFAESEIACVKATSFASEIAAELVPPAERALFLFAGPRKYIASILAGENSVKELELLAGARENRLAGRGINLPPARDDAERAAAAWACEMTSLEVAAGAMRDRQIEWADFDVLLVDMKAALTRIAGFFGFEASAERVETIINGPLMRRYSKALEYDYSPGLRAELIGNALAQYGQKIDGALAKLGEAAAQSPLLASALRRAQLEG